MSESRVADRYARALLRLDEKLGQDTCLKGLDACRFLFEHDEIRRVLKSPIVRASLKSEVLNYVLEQVGAEVLKDFIGEVVAAGRVPVLPEIYEAYKKRCHERSGVAEGELISAAPMEPAAVEAVTQDLSAKTKKTVYLTPRVDDRLLGGFIVKIGNTKIDLSLATKVEQLAQTAKA